MSYHFTMRLLRIAALAAVAVVGSSLVRRPSRPGPGLLRAVFASRPVLQLLRAACGVLRSRRRGGRIVRVAPPHAAAWSGTLTSRISR